MTTAKKAVAVSWPWVVSICVLLLGGAGKIISDRAYGRIDKNETKLDDHEERIGGNSTSADVLTETTERMDVTLNRLSDQIERQRTETREDFRLLIGAVRDLERHE